MAKGLQKVNFQGVLDTDTAVDSDAWNPANYTDNNAVQPITNSTESTQAHIAVLGDKFAFDLGSIIQQDKTWRVFTPQDIVNNTGAIFLYDQNGNLFPTINGQAQPMLWDRNQTLANQAISILALFTTIDGAGTTTVTSGLDYVDITTNTIVGYDIGLEARTIVGAFPTPIVITDTVLEAAVFQEAHDTTIVGPLNIVGSRDLQGDDYILSTSQKNMPLTNIGGTPGFASMSVVAAPAPTLQQYQIATNNVHGLTTGMKVAISGITYTGDANTRNPNGVWIVEFVNTVTFNLKEWYDIDPGAAFLYTGGGVITLYTTSIGEIGVAQKDINTAVWTYTRLLRTTKWDFRTKKQADFRVAERTVEKDSDYWTNDWEVPRVFYYDRPLNGIFVNAPWNGTVGDLDGAIEIINPNGHYAYSTVGEETKLLLSSTTARLNFLSQSQAGGAIPSGNSRYTFRFLSDSLSATQWDDLSNPINAYVAGFNGSPYDIIGDQPHVTTGKINNFQITGIVPGLFKYIELAFVNYVGDAIEGFVIKRVLLDNVSTTLNISHTGTETNVTDLDLGTLNTVFEPIQTARNMSAQDKRLILSNVTLAAQRDLTALGLAFKHSILRKELNAVQGNVQGTLIAGEYQDPNNVNGFMGYMHNETYRMGFKARDKKTGFWTDAFFIDDITINCNPTTPDGRRIAGLTDFNLTFLAGVGADEFIEIAYIGFQIDNTILDFLIDGQRFRDLYDKISFERAEVVPTVLACGMGILGVGRSSGTVAGCASQNGFDSTGAADTYRICTSPLTSAPDNVIEFPFASGRTFAPGPAMAANPLYTDFPFGGFLNNIRPRREYAAFYSPDIQFNNTSISFQGGDVIYNFGNPQYTAFNNGYNSDNLRAYSNYAQYSGRYNKSFAFPPVSVTLTDSQFVARAGSFISGAVTFLKNCYLETVSGVDGPGSIDNPSGMVFLSNGAPDFDNPAGFSFTPPDYGIYYMQYYRALTDQYGDKALTQYVPCGSILEVNATTPMGTQKVFGGDTFTQLTYFRHRLSSNFPNTGLGGGLSFYSQNRVNTQMKTKAVGTSLPLYPERPTVNWLETIALDNDDYQSGYTIRNQVQDDIAFDPNIPQETDLPVTIFYSDVKILGGPQDAYRNILPLNRHDLDNTDGEIVHHASFNGELFTWQPYKLQSQFFNSRGVLQTSATSIVVGDGSVMSRDGITITNYGCSHKWSIIIGRSIGGNDTAYWIDIVSKKAFRLAADGTLSLSDIKGMKSFFANNLHWIEGKDTPADGDGIRGVWHDRFSQVVWTVMGRRNDAPTWDIATTYSSVGELVFFQPVVSPYATFEKTGELFINKFNPNTGNTPVAVYPLPLIVSTIIGTTLLSVTTASNHLLRTGDQVKFKDLVGLSTDINGTYHVITRTGANTFDITVPLLVNNYVGSSGVIFEVIPKFWEFVKHTNSNYYNEYTIVYNELKKGFTMFLPPKPKIYLQWMNSYLEPRPIATVSRVYEANAGIELTWFTQGTSQTEQGYIEGVVQRNGDNTIWAEALRVLSDLIPKRFEFKTQTQESFLDDTNFEGFEDYFEAAIQEDSTVTPANPFGLNDNDTSLLFGRWVKVKMFFEVGVYQRLINFVCKFAVSPRETQK